MTDEAAETIDAPLTEGAFRARFVELIQRAVAEESGALIAELTERAERAEAEVQRVMARNNVLAERLRRQNG